MEDKLSLNKWNRSFINGQPVGDDLRHLVVTLILEAGGNSENKCIPKGVLSRVATVVKLSNTCVKHIWDRYCDTGSVAPRPHGGGKKKKLQEQDLLYVEQLKREHPSMYLCEVQEKLSRFSNIDVSVSTVSKALKHHMKDGQEKSWLALMRKDSHQITFDILRRFLIICLARIHTNLSSLTKVVSTCRKQ